jgi:hypothetical protein
MYRVAGWAIGLFAVGTLWPTSLPAQQTARARPVQAGVAPLRPIERFDGQTAWRTKAGTLQAVRVVIRNWAIHGRQRIGRFPEQGLMIVQLRAGEVTTVIDGKEQKRKGGAFWTVPKGSSMSVEVTSESASLQTMAVRPR